MAPPIMRLLAILSLTTPFVLSASTNSSSPSSMDMSAATSTGVDNSPEYSITALPAVQSAPSCLFNCLIPIGLADSSGCDDVTENCACLSAPADVLDFFTDCVETVCQTSTSAFIASATSLYESYCVSVYGVSSFSAAFVMESEMASMAAASSSIASVEATATSTGTSSAKATSSATTSAKSDGSTWSPSIFMATVSIGGLLLMIVL